MSTIAVNTNANIVVETGAAANATASTAVETTSAVPPSANTAPAPAAADADPAAAAPSVAAATAVNTPAAVYSVPPTVEAAHTDSEQIIVRSRNDFVSLYRACEAKTALATLEMCRAVYEAFKILSEAEFEAFCKEIGYKDTRAVFVQHGS